MLTVLPSSTLPNIYWLGQYARASKCVIDTGEHYVKQSYRNRYDIMGHLGRLNLSFPIRKESGMKVPTSEVRLFDEMHWKKLHWRSIVSAYNSSPYFEHYETSFKEVFFSEDVLLCKLNERLLIWLLSCLRIPLNHSFSSEFIEHADGLNDLRAHFKGVNWIELDFPPYLQVFNEKNGFVPNLSGIDLLFNLGPDASPYLRKIRSI